MMVENFMTKEVKCVVTEDNILKAAKIMAELNIGCVPVKNNDKVIGMVTDRDIVIRGLASDKDLSKIKCEDVMSHTVMSIDKNESAGVALKFMAEHKIRRLMVTDNGELAGVISIGDIADSEFSVEDIGRTLSKISEK
ncbi:MAG TPA: CBS domain-containing protein [Clostridiales bacterium]|nr:MAG: hypothetical protein A2Y18_07710 [Clostridiales bacterium GWD2_32_19]HCC06887.1 CBS domain-containing protein [Clostridiales bacterium]